MLRPLVIVLILMLGVTGAWGGGEDDYDSTRNGTDNAGGNGIDAEHCADKDGYGRTCGNGNDKGKDHFEFHG